jgi:hypothetical protein
MTDNTTNENKIFILADLWANYRTDENFEEFIKYNDLGLPLAYVLDNKIVELTEDAMRFVDETFTLLLSGLGVEDTGFTSLTELFENSQE